MYEETKAMKKTFQEPVIELLSLAGDDVIVTSGSGDDLNGWSDWV